MKVLCLLADALWGPCIVVVCRPSDSGTAVQASAKAAASYKSPCSVASQVTFTVILAVTVPPVVLLDLALRRLDAATVAATVDQGSASLEPQPTNVQLTALGLAAAVHFCHLHQVQIDTVFFVLLQICCDLQPQTLQNLWP